MTVMDALRSARPESGDPEPGGAPGRHLLPAVATGVVTALVSAALVLVPTLLAWHADARSSVPGGSALDLGSSLWFLAMGARLHVATTTLALVPLALWALLGAWTAYGAFRVLRHRGPDGERGRAPLPRSATVALAAWWTGYAAVVAVGLLLARSGPAAPVGWSLVHPFVVLPGIASAVAVAAQRRHEEDLVDPTLARALLPEPVRRGFRPALRGVGTLVGLGSLVVVAAVLWHLGDVRHVQAALDAGGLGGLVLVTAQLSALPNLGLWAVSFLAGPGFQVVDGARTSLGGSQSGLMPIVPAFAALPAPGDFPIVLFVLVLVPVVVGVVIGRRSLAAVARLSGLRTKVSVAVTAALLTAVMVGALDGFAGGRLGTYKLAHVGAPAVPLMAALAVELTLGALAAVARDAWRLRR